MLNAISEPLGRLLFYIYGMVNSYGLSIVVFTIIVKLVLLPLTLKQTKSMKQMQELQPKIKELQKKYAKDKQKLNEKTMELYQKHNVNPAGGCLPLLIQLPILIALFQVLRQPELYVFPPEVYETVEKSFLWIKDLSATSSFMESIKDPIMWILPVLAAVTTYYQSKMSTPTGTDNPSQSTMTVVMPLMIGYFSFSFPAGVTLYWVLSNLFQIVQQYFLMLRSGAVEEGSN